MNTMIAMQSTALHLTLLLYSGDLIREAWPDVFHLSYLDHVHYFPEEGMLFAPGSGE